MAVEILFTPSPKDTVVSRQTQIKEYQMANKKEQPEKPIKEEAVVEAHDDYIARKLKAVNNMQKPAKAERVAHRLLRKARNN